MGLAGFWTDKRRKCLTERARVLGKQKGGFEGEGGEGVDWSEAAVRFGVMLRVLLVVVR